MSQQEFRHNILEKRLIRFNKIHNVIYGNIIQSTTNELWIWYLQIINALIGTDLLRFWKRICYMYLISLYKYFTLFDFFISISTNEISFHFCFTPLSSLWYILKQRRDCLMTCKTSLQGIYYIGSVGRSWLTGRGCRIYTRHMARNKPT